MEKKRKEQLNQQDKVPETLHIDEIAHRKGWGNFMTIISDEENVRETAMGRSSDEVIKKLLSIPYISEVKKVCIDMCSPFAKAIKNVIPHAETILDRFHIMKIVHKRLFELNKKTFKNLAKKERKRFSKIRFLLSKARKQLKKWEKKLIKEYLKLNSEMKCIYWKIQGFREILFRYQGKEKSFVSQKLEQWLIGTEKYFAKFTKTLKKWWNEVVNACVYRESNARQEGLNNKIKTVKRRACGYTNWLNFEYRIRGECNA